MSVGKSFGISFVIYIVFNFVMALLLNLAVGVNLGTWFSSIGSQPYVFLAILFVGPLGLGVVPNQILSSVSQGIGYLNTNIFLAVIFFIVAWLPGLIAAIFAGKMAEGPGEGFVGWFLTAFVSAAIVLVFWFLDGQTIGAGALGGLMADIFVYAPDMIFTIVDVILFGTMNGLFWGGIAALTGREI
ncbi:MAG: hypothetical protein ACTSU2_04805 [Promethearchaeota archaeon]